MFPQFFDSITILYAMRCDADVRYNTLMNPICSYCITIYTWRKRDE